MKANTIPRSMGDMARSGARISCLLLSAVTLSISSAADPPERANPESKPLKDESAKAGKDSKPVRDSSKASGNDSRPVQDEGRKANERSQEQPAEANPVTDGSGKANPDSRPVQDNAPASGNDSRKVQDGNSNKASPDARRTSDSSRKAGPQAAAVNDGNNKANPASRPTSPADRAKQAETEVAPDEPSAFESETTVREAVTEAEAAVRQSKLRIGNAEEARAIIGGILAADGPVSRAEQDRGDVLADEAAAAGAEVPDAMREEARVYLRDYFRGQVTVDRKVPTFFGADLGKEENRSVNPLDDEWRFFQSGRRYVHFHSKTSIPAVVLAHVFLANLELQSAAQAAKLFSTPDDQLARLPVEYRSADAWVISYPVHKDGVFSTDGISFRPRTTQFADSLSHDMVEMLAETLKDPSFQGQRFVIEVHGSPDGSFEENQILSQERAEAIARALVREGVPVDQLIPVGYGRSEARQPADPRERRVIIFRLGGSDEKEKEEILSE